MNISCLLKKSDFFGYFVKSNRITDIICSGKIEREDNVFVQ